MRLRLSLVLRLRSLQVRKAAVTALPELVNDALLAVQNPQVATDPAHDVRWVKAMLDAMLAGLCEAALKEPETEIVASMLEAVKETIDYAGELLQVREREGLCRASFHSSSSVFRPRGALAGGGVVEFMRRKVREECGR